jgi:hypothetical protein
MFVLGAMGFIHEVFFGPIDRPTIIAASCALMGLPLVLKADRARNGD